MRATVEQIAADFGRIDILVNIAGITARIPTTEIPPEQVRRLTEVNYYGTFWMCQEVGRIMLAQGGGNIVNMSALGGGLLGTGRGNAAYSSTKGAIAALTRELACEWGDAGIRVNAVAPCWFQTDMNATSIFANKRFMEQVMTKLPMRRIGQPHELVGPDRLPGQRSLVDDHRPGAAGGRRRGGNLPHRVASGSIADHQPFRRAFNRIIHGETLARNASEGAARTYPR